MGKYLIIAEKPSLAKNIANAIGNTKKQDGYFENDKYIVSFAFGHLFELFSISDYTGENGWNMNILPYYPEKFSFNLRKDKDGGIKKQFNILKKLISRNDVDSIIHCGDADREGEVIIRLPLIFAKNTKPVYRLWLPEQTTDTIRHELKHMKKDSEYDPLYNAGMCRMQMDWLYGINLTTYVTLKVGIRGKVWNVGRVITPIIKAIYDRDLARTNFVSEKYYKIESRTEIDGIELLLTSNKKYSSEEFKLAEAKAKELNDSQAEVLEVEQKKKVKSPAKLFSLSKLQGVAGKKFKLSPKETLSIVQDLYEKGYVTYPRTNSEYLAEAEREKVTKIITSMEEKGVITSGELEPKEGKRIYNDSKIESHSAITPTVKIPKEGELSGKSADIYNTILNRFKSAFCASECIAAETVAQIKVSDEIIKVKGSQIIEKGWLVYENDNKKDKLLPSLTKGQKIDVDFKPVEKETEPPKAYTTDSLNNYLKNPFAKEDKDDESTYDNLKKGIEIGTEATRAGIIDTAIKGGYITLSNNTYSITDTGKAYIKYLNDLNIDMTAEKTVEFQKLIQAVYQGELKIDDAIKQAKEKINECFKNRDIVLDVQRDEENIIGQCPKCGKNVISKSGKFGTYYPCENPDCDFKIPGKYAGKKINEQVAFELLDRGSTKKKVSGFISNKGNKFSAYLELNDENKVTLNFD